MRFYLAAMAATVMSSGSAAASSFVVIDAPQAAATPSIIIADETSVAAAKPSASSIVAERGPVPQDDKYLPVLDPLGVMVSPKDGPSRIQQVTASIAEVVEPMPIVSHEMVAAIRKKTARVVQSILVMRGGIVGDAFPDPQPAATPDDATARLTPADIAAPNWLKPKTIVTQKSPDQPVPTGQPVPAGQPVPVVATRPNQPPTQDQQAADREAVEKQLR